MYMHVYLLRHNMYNVYILYLLYIVYVLYIYKYTYIYCLLPMVARLLVWDGVGMVWIASICRYLVGRGSAGLAGEVSGHAL